MGGVHGVVEVFSCTVSGHSSLASPLIESSAEQPRLGIPVKLTLKPVGSRSRGQSWPCDPRRVPFGCKLSTEVLPSGKSSGEAPSCIKLSGGIPSGVSDEIILGS